MCAKYEIWNKIFFFYRKVLPRTKSFCKIRIQATQFGIYNNHLFGRNKKRDLFFFSFSVFGQKLSLLPNVVTVRRSFNPLKIFSSNEMKFYVSVSSWERWKFVGIGKTVLNVIFGLDSLVRKHGELEIQNIFECYDFWKNLLNLQSFRNKSLILFTQAYYFPLFCSFMQKLLRVMVIIMFRAVIR
jgi:hypothetical protein